VAKVAMAHGLNATHLYMRHRRFAQLQRQRGLGEAAGFHTRAMPCRASKRSIAAFHCLADANSVVASRWFIRDRRDPTVAASATALKECLI
jgi:hypothetical protein